MYVCVCIYIYIYIYKSTHIGRIYYLYIYIYTHKSFAPEDARLAGHRAGSKEIEREALQAACSMLLRQVVYDVYLSLSLSLYIYIYIYIYIYT